MSDQKNMIIAIALSLVILLGFQFLYEFPKMEKEKEREELLAASQPLQTPGASGGVTADGSTAPNVAAPGGAISAPAVAQTVVTAAQRAEALKSTPRVNIETESLSGSISLKGGRIDDIILKNYHEEVDKTSELIRLLSPIGAPKSYYAEYG